MQTVDFNKFPLNNGERVLDLGCGEGRHVIHSYLQADLQAFGIDLCLEDVQTTRRKLSDFLQPDNIEKSAGLAVGNALHLPFADNTFDKVICSEVLEHIPDYQLVLNEIDRILKPGGFFAASVPSYGPEWVCWKLSEGYRNMPGGHVRIFKAGQLRNDIEALGMSCYAKHRAHALHSPFWWLKCLLWNRRDDSRLVTWYHNLLVWDLMKKPWITQTLEKLLNPVLGKSVVMYFEKPVAAT